MTTLFKHLAVAFAWLMAAGPALAATISTPSLNDIYGQSAFGSSPITINWLAPGTPIVNPGLLSIDNAGELNSLFALHQGPATTVSTFFVDTIGFCGIAGTDILGCAVPRGNVFVVQSARAESATGLAVIGHELGHDLGLSHVGGIATNLMNAGLGTTLSNGMLALTTAQVDAIFGLLPNTTRSPLIQTAANGSLFIDIIPIAVVSSIPEPQQALMFALGIFLVVAIARRRLCA